MRNGSKYAMLRNLSAAISYIILASLGAYASAITYLVSSDNYGYYRTIYPKEMTDFSDAIVAAGFAGAFIVIVSRFSILSKFAFILLFLIGAVCAMLAPYMLGIPYPIDAKSLKDGRHVMLAFDQPLSEAGLALYEERGFGSNSWTKINERMIQANNNSNTENTSLVYLEKSDYLLIQTDDKFVDCFSVKNYTVVSCFNQIDNKNSSQKSDEIAKLVHRNP